MYKRFQDPVFFVKAMDKANLFYSLTSYSYSYRIKHKSILWNYEKIKDHLAGIRELLLFSSQKNLCHLHYLMSKNLLETVRYKINFSLKPLFFFEVIKLITLMNRNLLTSENPKNKVKITSAKIVYNLFLINR